MLRRARVIFNPFGKIRFGKLTTALALIMYNTLKINILVDTIKWSVGGLCVEYAKEVRTAEFAKRSLFDITAHETIGAPTYHKQ